MHSNLLLARYMWFPYLCRQYWIVQVYVLQSKWMCMFISSPTTIVHPHSPHVLHISFIHKNQVCTSAIFKYMQLLKFEYEIVIFLPIIMYFLQWTTNLHSIVALFFQVHMYVMRINISSPCVWMLHTMILLWTLIW